MLDNCDRDDRCARAASGIRCTGVGGRRLFPFSTSHQLHGICVDAVPPSIAPPTMHREKLLLQSV